MRITTERSGGAARLRLEGRLDREWAAQLSRALERLLQHGVRSLTIDLARVSYISSAAIEVLARSHQELALLRGEVFLAEVPEVVRHAFGVSGWEPGLEQDGNSADLRRSSWHTREDFAAGGLYEFSKLKGAGELTCRIHGDTGRLGVERVGPEDCHAVPFPEGVFGAGVGAIGTGYADCHERFGELVAAGGCVAYFPSDGARVADFLAGGEAGRAAPKAVLAAGFSCQGDFSQLIRFSTRPEAAGVPLSELAAIGLDAAGGGTAGMVIAAETAGLCGTRLRRSPAHAGAPLSFELPALRDWLMFAPERIHPMSTTVIAGVVARKAGGPLASQLKPLGEPGRLFGHFHAAAFSYHPLPQRTVQLAPLVRELFTGHHLRDVLHLLWDPRRPGGVPETELLRGVAWVAPVAHFG